MYKNQNLIHHTSTYGAVSGFLLIIASVVFYLLNILPASFGQIAITSIVNYTILIGFTVLGTKAYRDLVLNGYIPFNRAFITGLLIVVFSSILVDFYNLVFTTWIDPGYVDKTYAALKDWMFNVFTKAGYPDEMIDLYMDRLDEQQAGYSPLLNFFSGIGGAVISGSLISLITSAILKKNPDPFNEIN